MDDIYKLMFQELADLVPPFLLARSWSLMEFGLLVRASWSAIELIFLLPPLSLGSTVGLGAGGGGGGRGARQARH